jgi:hypothetical protein
VHKQVRKYIFMVPAALWESKIKEWKVES